MVAYEVTLKDLRQAKACYTGYNKLVCSLQGQPFTDKYRDMKSYIRFAYKEPISLSFILENNGLDDALWALRCIKDADRDIRLFSVWCARQVQHLMIDSQSTNTLDVVERFANGKATKEELDAATDAATDAASAAWSASVENATWAAAWAVSAAWAASTENASASATTTWDAESAATDAATDAARAAWAVRAVRDAESAVRAVRDAESAVRAVRDAASAVRAVSAESAAWASAWAVSAAQTEMFKLMCDGKAPWQVSGLD